MASKPTRMAGAAKHKCVALPKLSLYIALLENSLTSQDEEKSGDSGSIVLAQTLSACPKS